jgi:hypothetical protein
MLTGRPGLAHRPLVLGQAEVAVARAVRDVHGEDDRRNGPPTAFPVIAVASAPAGERVDPDDARERGSEVARAGDVDALGIGRDGDPIADRGSAGGSDDIAAEVDRLAGDVGVVRRRGDLVLARAERDGVGHIRVRLRRATKALGEDNGARVRGSIRAVLDAALLRIRIAGIDDEPDARDECHEAEREEDDDLALRAAPIRPLRPRRHLRSSPRHGCLGHWAAVCVLFGHWYSTGKTVLAVNVTPLLNSTRPMTGVIGV